ncbi:MAG TPA: FAD-dependent oxidoreductase [Polyangiaceae bacterium]|nr:FAD-dependent oxidoreductase [Polyangiaceae bacterium]
MRVGITGAGPAGMTAAYCLAREGESVEVFEAANEVGGLARSLELWGQIVDMGPHRFFSADKRVNELWLEVVGRDYRLVDRLTRIYYRQRFFYYPLRAMNALFTLGPREALSCAASYARERTSPTAQDGTFESWVVSRFGRKLFEIFFKTYSEKLWGIPCTELDATFAAQRIKGLSLWEAAKNALSPQGGSSKHKTLVDQFAYPLEGTGMVYRRMRERVEEHGGKVHVATPVRRILVEDGRAAGLELASGERRRYDHLISSMPLTLLVQGIEGAPEEIRRLAAQLTFRNTILVYLHLDAEDLFPDQWIYVHAPDLLTGRITNFRNWVPELNRGERTTIVAMEYWCYEQDEIWRRDDAGLIALASGELAATGLARGAAVLDGKVLRLPRCYPVYARGYRERLAPIQDYLASIAGLSVIGRYGAFKYNNQDHSILMGILAAENIAHGAHHDLWSVNTDTEAYHEAYVITETGLDRRAG